ncbi:hypothetical protein KTO58_09285 [Chitinophaga pendula]|uniref:hypothetical protein n=1 Tax=Chitinophaga TaxID=79328 RepID=UPI000BAFCA7F|nr:MULTISPECIES: hypothetical protein [Chitinophaga]ASZ13010.1 hypothetical protein CK934_19630 [Chitinophaga sp. MD30]UCJ09359.1 hypothetical protein KTO58_09285 [Chitinophaga pendula]
MQKTLLFSLLSVFIFANSYAIIPNSNRTSINIQPTPAAATYNVRIALQDSKGNPVNGSGLRGYWARNVQTGEYIYPGERAEENKFFDLPAGTYTFGAYEGAWEGASRETITLSQGKVGSDGFIVVTLIHWSE